MALNLFAVLRRWLTWLAQFSALVLALLFVCLYMGLPGAVLGAVIGWLSAGWFGLVVGLLTGPVGWMVLWALKCYVAVRSRLQRQLRRMSELSTDELCRIAKEPTSPDLGIALMELDRRGVDAPSPSLESLLALLTSSDSNRRGLGMSLLVAFYPSVISVLPEGCSNQEPPEIWRERIAAIRGAIDSD